MGIAGEDDADAPDLVASASMRGPGTAGRSTNGNGAGPGRRNGRLSAALYRPALSEPDSAASRERLLGELSVLISPEDLASWAHRILPTKNTLTVFDAQLLEEAFTAKMTAVAEPMTDFATSVTIAAAPAFADTPTAPSISKSDNGAKRLGRGFKSARRKVSARPTIDKSVLTFPEPRRLRDKEHLKFVATQPCLICERQPADAHHIRFAQLRALGRKVSDEFTVPLCRTHHREVHRNGDEAAWWGELRLDPLAVASSLWRETHPLPAKHEWVGKNASGKVGKGAHAEPQVHPDDKTNPIKPANAP